MWIITCPECPYTGPLDSYEPSCADECTCPKCGCSFEFEAPADEDDEAEGE
jgi:hypothetical protein